MKPARPSATDRAGTVRQIARWIENGEFSRAKQRLDGLLRLSPADRDLHELSLSLACKVQDPIGVEDSARWLAQHYPGNPSYQLRLIASAAISSCDALAVRRIREFVQRWPDHAESERLRSKCLESEREVCRGLDEIGITGDDRFDMAVENDFVQLLMEAGRFQDAILAAKAALEKGPGHFPLRNNLGLSYIYNHQIDEAQCEFNTSLSTRPDNIHALVDFKDFVALKGVLDFNDLWDIVGLSA